IRPTGRAGTAPGPDTARLIAVGSGRATGPEPRAVGGRPAPERVGRARPGRDRRASVASQGRPGPQVARAAARMMKDRRAPDQTRAPEPAATGDGEEAPGSLLHVEGAGSLPTLRVLPQGISRKRLEQSVRELQLPVVIARDVDDADVVMTLKSEYRQKTPMLREAEER